MEYFGANTRGEPDEIKTDAGGSWNSILPDYGMGAAGSGCPKTRNGGIDGHDQLHGEIGERQ
jgi:hypothetical protein